jgi:GNAT superfamily N-acetyltransferase
VKPKQITRIRPLTLADIDAIMQIQSACYPASLLEDAVHLAAKHLQSPSSCWVAVHQDEVLAYLLTHPWDSDLPPDINTPLPPVSPHSPIHYIHDLAVHPKAQGLGLARQLLDAALLWSKQQDFTHLRLIAIAGAEPFWLKQGFQPVTQLNEKIISKLSFYGPNTHYLEVSFK